MPIDLSKWTESLTIEALCHNLEKVLYGPGQGYPKEWCEAIVAESVKRLRQHPDAPDHNVVSITRGDDNAA